MAYTSGLLKYRVTILNKQVASGFGETTSYQPAATVWADVTWSKGAKALREGALDAYDSVIFRMNFSSNVAKTIIRDSLIEMHGKIYQIQSLNSDYRENKIIIRATEMTTQVSIIDDFNEDYDDDYSGVAPSSSGNI